ncbi:flavin-containing monooxygenase [Sphingomonas qomolangmaensis]|uniref:NAD(P)/FAD-dependent oxidoreductase n=1 Tax=Sphingomonas qomolangmaensis TaxID=2918765 RepID=A0ABY5L9H3_9SPHN|nr:NAD(P)/FAD-dependent oxidoreductase [Sphingomonas qomolangmaensis]UUL83092.1 NAD(P)/FAD-dependent oxidoreductase [Sphingomonas qomolangmaensis]
MTVEHFDVVVVGAGLSGIGAGHYLRERCPDRSFVILEGRARMGGTWDLFRYPGIRSDSDMHTLGYAFKPWNEAKAIADGPSILRYIEETAHEDDLDSRIRYRERVVGADWSSADACWTLTVEAEGAGRRTYTCNFLHMCTGYYDYAKGYTPDFAGRDDFAGTIVHPQFWPADLDYAGKRVVVIGSGATAVTLVPELAKTAAHVTMLQRSPSYVVARPSHDRFANWLRTVAPSKVAYGVVRWRNVLLGQFFYGRTRKYPERTKKRLLGWVRGHLGPDYDVDTHFTPSYNPWDQRLCLVPDADLFETIKRGEASVVTGHIDRFTPTGIRLTNGEEVPADIIVTATGLELQLMADMPVTVDGTAIDFSQTLNYKGMMFSGVPNLAYSFGYTNASWTLKADLTAAYVCRLLNAMTKRGLRQATPVPGDTDAAAHPFLDFSSGYVQRALDRFPKQGARAPWKLHQSYARDLVALRFGSIDDDMVFSNPSRQKRAA